MGEVHFPLSEIEFEACCPDAEEKTISCYMRALKRDISRDFAQTVALWRLSDVNATYAAAGYINQLRKQGIPAPDYCSWRILYNINNVLWSSTVDRLVHRVPLDELLKVIDYLGADPDDMTYLDDIMKARVAVLSGRRDDALKGFCNLQLRVRCQSKPPRMDGSYWSSNYPPQTLVDRSIFELSGYKLGGIGAGFEDLTSDATQQTFADMHCGVIVEDIRPAGPADLAGIHKGDVVVALNGNLIRDKSHIHSILAPMLSGETVTLELMRQGLQYNKDRVDVTLDERIEEIPYDRGFSGICNRIVDRRQNHALEIYTYRSAFLVMADITEAIIDAFYLDKNMQGAIVLEPYHLSKDAYSESYSVGDIFLAVDDKPVSTAQEVKTIVDEAVRRGATSIPVQVLKEDRTVFSELKVEL